MKCKHCGAEIEIVKELMYENANDPTPEYGGELKEVEIVECSECGN